jgi:uncharacterized protein with FMN-binding domain/succinate dehydrogenase/fumarate reductase flavoprotein subunit
MKRRITALALAIVMVLGTAALAAGTEKTITVTPMTLNINGQNVTPTKSNGAAAEVFAYDGATYVPLRYLSELLGLNVEWDKNDPTTAKLTGDVTLPAAGGDGTYTGTAAGFGGEVKAVITVVNGKITACTLEGAKETPGIGGAALETLKAQVEAAGSAEIDGVSGATVTSNAVKAAVAAALDQAKGAGAAAVKMKPGTYTAYAESYRARDGLHVTVEVSETEIKSITVDKKNTSDTPTILQAAIDKLIPRMLQHQSVSIDAITGATASSNAIKMATATALEEALKAGGSDPSAIRSFQVVPEKKGGQETIDTEVLVIGMGGSGTTAAMSAVESGLQVLAIDKAGKYGGTSSITSEGLFVNPPKFQAEHNNGKDYTDADVMYKAWVEYDEGDGKEEIIHRMIYESGQVLDWLVYEHGFQFAEPLRGFTPSDVYDTKYQWLPNDIMYNKDAIGSYFDGIYEDYTALGGKYMLETEGYALLTDAKGNVTGAKARDLVNGTEYTINAKAVVIACGGYAGNPELVEEMLEETYFPIKGQWKQVGSLQNDGKMFEAALDIGAGTYNNSMAPEVHNSGTATWLTADPRFGQHFVEGKVGEVLGRPAWWTEADLPANLGWSANSLAVDKTGKRFAAETGVSFLDPWIAGPNYYSIWSQAQLDDIAKNGLKVENFGPSPAFLGSGYQIPGGVPVPQVDKVMEAAEEAGIVVKADTIEALATKLGMDPATLSKTVKDYNGYCDTGVDKEFGKDAALLEKVEGGPYYCVIMASYCYDTCGGLNINERLEVLRDKDESVIEGLYAVGTSSMGVLFTEKKPYVTYGGANNGWGMVSGYLCGKEIAEKLGK